VLPTESFPISGLLAQFFIADRFSSPAFSSPNLYSSPTKVSQCTAAKAALRLD
jgi:hypothetical protein